MRSHLSILSACAVGALLVAGCVEASRDYYPEDRTATSPAPKRLEADLSTNIYGNKEYQAGSEKVIVATEEAIDWSVRPSKKPIVAKMPAVKPETVTIQPMINDPVVPMEKPVMSASSRASVSRSMDNDYLGDAYKSLGTSTDSSVLESYKQVAGSNFETRSSMSATPAPMPMPSNIAGGGNVEIFDLNDGAPMASGGMAQTMNTPQSYQARAGVTIYPLDGVNPMQPQYAPMPTVNAMNYSGSSMGADEGKIYFKHGSDRLGSGDKRRLSNIAQQAKTAGRVEVEGYASKPTQSNNTITSKVLNLKESMNRSYAVSKDLIKNGVPADKIKTVGWGEGQATGNNVEDRRVDVTVNPY